MSERSDNEPGEKPTDKPGWPDLRPEATLPIVRTKTPRADVLARLEGAARRGKLAGFEKTAERSFRLDAFGDPFDYDLNAEMATPPDATASDSDEPETTIGFSLAMRRAKPMIFAIVLLLTIEPGRYFVDQMIPGTWGWPNTMLWYYPLAIVPIPFLWRHFMRKSRATGREHAIEQIEKVAKFADGRVEPS